MEDQEEQERCRCSRRDPSAGAGNVDRMRNVDKVISTNENDNIGECIEISFSIGNLCVKLIVKIDDCWTGIEIAWLRSAKLPLQGDKAAWRCDKYISSLRQLSRSILLLVSIMLYGKNNSLTMRGRSKKKLINAVVFRERNCEGEFDDGLRDTIPLGVSRVFNVETARTSRNQIVSTRTMRGERRTKRREREGVPSVT